ncbi:MAG: hypothetical protein GC185_00595 [Alphaproteobacteria bacterium]|nr:hypothetical protein [Alphaproteobacteria bacterium]
MALAGWYGYLHSPYYAHAEALRKARQGDAAAQYRLCLDYIGGVGREADMAEAAKWALKARAQGYNCEEKIGDDKIIADLHREMAKQQGNAK